jgi:glycosyltransferase involved in cell wall biosynthesis
MRALRELGHEVAFVTQTRPAAEAVAGIDLAWQHTATNEAWSPGRSESFTLTRWQDRFRSYWGIDQAFISAVGRLAADWDADAVIAVGLNLLPCLAGVRGSVRVWYAADESAWHHLSQLRLAHPRSWKHLARAAVNGLYERTCVGLADRVWVVSEGDRRAMRWVAGARNTDVLANGVDCDHYQPASVEQLPASCTFWGGLDFGPNVQALDWFCRKVWPPLVGWVPNARFTIYGFQPCPAVWRLNEQKGVCVVPDMPDLRAGIAAHQLAVLPFISGGGIKNKLLEAAALGKAIVCTPRACGGLRSQEPLPVLRAHGAADWVDAIRTLWQQPERCRQLGADARQWVQTHHTWQAAAGEAAASIERSDAMTNVEGRMTNQCPMTNA